MKADPKGVLTGVHFFNGDEACCEGAISAGCRFVAGYPITPSTEVVERIAVRFPFVGGRFIQMEDELAASIAILGGAWAGAKTMTVTSGPGFSLMMEHLGLAVMMEVPCVLVNVQRGGPSTGLPTLTGQSDMMQARWGSHGDYRVIALSPNSPQECFDLMIKAFNLSEQYRVPALLMTDECVGHMTERVAIPPAEEIDLIPRRFTTLPPSEYRPYLADPDGVPPMVKTGDGYRIHITGLTHDEKGYPAMNAEAHDKLVRRLVDKIDRNAEDIYEYDEEHLEDCDLVVVSFGITSRVAQEAVDRARRQGRKVGHLRLIVVWPFPEKRIRSLAKQVGAFVVPEVNLGQIALEVERCAEGKARVLRVSHGGGTVHTPDVIEKKIMEAYNGSGSGASSG